MDSPQNIIVLRLQDIGDMLVFIPFLRSLRRAYPGARISLITRSKAGHEVARGCPFVDRVIRAGRGFGEKAAFFYRLRRLKPDIFLLSTSELSKVRWGVLAGAKVIAGYKRLYYFNEVKEAKWSNFITVAPEFDNSKSEIENNLDILRAIGVSEPKADMEYSWIAETDTRAVREMLAAAGVSDDDPVIIISPGGKQKTKKWFPERFASLADRIIENFGVKVIISGGVEEQEESAAIMSLAAYPLISLAGKTSLGQLPALIERSRLVITVDSGTMHFAAALGKPFVALFGPGNYSKWAHRNNEERWINIRKELPCSPCEKEQCETVECMKAIEVDEVYEKVGKLMEIHTN